MRFLFFFFFLVKTTKGIHSHPAELCEKMKIHEVSQLLLAEEMNEETSQQAKRGDI